VRRGDGCSALIKVSTATVAEVRGALQGQLFESTTQPGVNEQAALIDFAARVALPDVPMFFDAVPGLVLFPGVARADLDMVQPAMLPSGIVWGAKEDLAPDRFTSWVEEQLGAPLTATQSDIMRRTFAPEIVVPAQLTVPAPVDRGTDARLTDYMLSYNQEWVLKHDLDLSDEAATASDDLRLQLVNGVAGSGKSLILVYRARLLRQFFPHKRVLVLTHNKPLILDIALAKLFGATDFVSERGEDAVERVRELTGGYGVHAVLECVGYRPVDANISQHRTSRGAIGRVGVPHDVTIPAASPTFFSNLTSSGGSAPARAYFAELLPDVLEGTIEPGRVFDRVVSLDEVPDGYRAMGEREAIKVMVKL
jgi:hypothetical protein